MAYQTAPLPMQLNIIHLLQKPLRCNLLYTDEACGHAVSSSTDEPYITRPRRLHSRRRGYSVQSRLFVLALKGKRLKLSIPNSTHVHSIVVARRALTRGQKVVLGRQKVVTWLQKPSRLLVTRAATAVCYRQHLSFGVCQEDKREDNQNCSVLCCVRQLCIMIRTHTHTHTHTREQVLHFGMLVWFRYLFVCLFRFCLVFALSC